MNLETGTVLNNLYRVVRLLGKGSMGNVYLVERIENNRKFVVKVLLFSEKASLNSEDAREIFFREAEFMAKFDHPGIPRVHGVFSQDGRDYLVMDYIEGKTLEEIISASKSPLDIDKAIKWTIELCEILDYLHNSFHAPIVYRDLKPSNVIITPEGKVKLVDFGIARYFNPDKNTDTFSYGSPGYAPPEQYKGRGQTTPQSDIFALGVILFQMLTGYDPSEKPFYFPPITLQNPSVGVNLEGIIKKAIELDPMKRYISIKEFKERLEKDMKFSSSARESSSSFSGQTKKQMSPLTLLINFICSFFIPFTGYALPAVAYIVSVFIMVKFDLDDYLFKIFMSVVACWFALFIIFVLLGHGQKINIKINALLVCWMLMACPCIVFGPNIPRARAQGKLCLCESNLKNIATSLEMYAADFEGYYPPALGNLLEPQELYIITGETIKQSESRLDPARLLAMEPLTGSTLKRCEMVEELTSRNLNRDDFETVISYTDRVKGDAYIETLPLCLSARSPYIYEVSAEKDNFTLCCGKEKSHIAAFSIPSEGCWPQYTPVEGLRLK